jgi:microcystin-dependent protein
MPSHVHTGTTDTNGLHSHTYEGITGQGSLGGTLDTVADEINRPTVSTSANGEHTHTFTTQGNGSSQPHNNMQPTLFIGHIFIYGGDYYEQTTAPH